MFKNITTKIKKNQQMPAPLTKRRHTGYHENKPKIKKNRRTTVKKKNYKTIKMFKQKN